jgi:hypothetical protein
MTIIAPQMLASVVFEPPSVTLLRGSFGATIVDITVPGTGGYEITLDEDLASPDPRSVAWPTWGTPSTDITIPFPFATRTFSWAWVSATTLRMMVKDYGGQPTDLLFPPADYRVFIQVWRLPDIR